MRSVNGSKETGGGISPTCALTCTVDDARGFLKTPPNFKLANEYMNMVRAI